MSDRFSVLTVLRRSADWILYYDMNGLCMDHRPLLLPIILIIIEHNRLVLTLTRIYIGGILRVNMYNHWILHHHSLAFENHQQSPIGILINLPQPSPDFLRFTTLHSLQE